jgi:hypothetical protein
MLKTDWEDKIKRARQVEKEILKWYRVIDPEAKLTEGYNADYDILGKKNSIEVKEDCMAHQTGNYALEYETHDGKPSGYAGTKANLFCIVDWEYVCLMDTHVLKDIIDSMELKNTINMGQTFSDGKSNKGWLIPRAKILNNPNVQVLERWFPRWKM